LGVKKESEANMVTTHSCTVADLETLPDDGNRYEIIDGELLVSTQPDWRHQRVSGRIQTALDVWSDISGKGEPIFAPGVILSATDAVAPDVVWISTSRMAEAWSPDGKLHAAPEVVVEVLSPGTSNERRDREAKLQMYSQHGVEEYWIVDWRSRSIDVYRRDGGCLALAVSLGASDILESPLLPGFHVRVDHIFKNIPA